MDVILALLSMPYDFWFALLLMICGLYIVFIAPLIFRFWIIPKIENRYKGVILVFDNPVYTCAPFSNWGIPPLEISLYIFCKYMGWEIPLTKNSHTALKKINYDINTASKAEIVMSFTSVFFIICVIISGIVVMTAKNA